MDMSSRLHLRVKICRRLLFLFIKSLLLHVPTRKMTNLLETYNTYIEYIEEASFCRLIMRINALERYQHVEVENVIEIRECDDKDVVTHQKVAILELNHYFLTHLVILDVVVMKFNTILTSFMELVDS
jgi:hypothetical protein